MRLLTLNTEQMPYPFGKELRTERAQRLSDIILSNEDFDIICLQEVFWRPSRQIFINKLKHKYPYYYVDDSFGRYFIGLNSGLAIFSKHPIVDHISHTYKDYRGVENLAKKGVMGVKLNISEITKLNVKRDFQDDFVYVFTTHIQSGIGEEPYIFTIFDKYSSSPGSTMGSKELKESQLKELVKTIEKFCGFEERIVIAGDLNIDSSGGDYITLNNIMNSIRLKDTFYKNDSIKSSVLHGEKRVDYVWSNMVGKSIITDKYGNSKTTDHRDVIAKFITYNKRSTKGLSFKPNIFQR